LDVSPRNMRATITEAYDLELRWEAGGARRIVFEPVSESEFEVRVDLHLTEGLNYQTPTRISFSTTCYARSLWDFRDSLSALERGDIDSARYCGTEDMELLVGVEAQQPEIGQRKALICTLVYEPFQILEEIALPGSLRVPLGGIENIEEVVRVMSEFTSVLKMRPDDWSNAGSG
jgi:hypothetical protein